MKPICTKPWTRLYVTTSGDCYNCCYQIQAFHRISENDTESFEKIWNNKKIQVIRKTLLSGKMPKECDCLTKYGKIPPDSSEPTTIPLSDAPYVPNLDKHRSTVCEMPPPSMKLVPLNISLNAIKTERLSVKDPKDRRNEFIERVVKDKTFADVGGLWQVVNEKLSIAHKFGAREVTLVDMCNSQHESWNKFRGLMKQLNIKAKVVNKNLFDVNATYDVVHCSGVIYHCPDFQKSIQSLLDMTNKYLILSSCVCHASYGQLISPKNGFYIPSLSDKDMNLKNHWKNLIKETKHEAIGITIPSNFHPQDYASFWHLPSIPYFREIVQKFNGKIIDESSFWGANAHILLIDCSHRKRNA